MTRAQFEVLVSEGIRAIPKKFRDKLDNVDIVIEESPPKSLRDFGGDHKNLSLLGLYQGVPRTKRTTFYSGVLPDKITIFQKPIEKKAGGSKEKIRQLVKRVVWHEIAHHFGIGESQVRKIETKKFKI
ncbi:metallopeptidase family protein [bacterium]|nr:metallopeptidase family protein [bacterium]